MITRFLLLFFIIGTSTFSFSQDLTIEKMWKNYEFFGASVDGFRSMKNGEHFTKTISDSKGSSIQKFSFKDSDGKGVVVVSPEILNGIQMDGYSFTLTKQKY